MAETVEAVKKTHIIKQVLKILSVNFSVRPAFKDSRKERVVSSDKMLGPDTEIKRIVIKKLFVTSPEVLLHSEFYAHKYFNFLSVDFTEPFYLPLILCNIEIIDCAGLRVIVVNMVSKTEHINAGSNGGLHLILHRCLRVCGK